MQRDTDVKLMLDDHDEITNKQRNHRLRRSFVAKVMTRELNNWSLMLYKCACAIKYHVAWLMKMVSNSRSNLCSRWPQSFIVQYISDAALIKRQTRFTRSVNACVINWNAFVVKLASLTGSCKIKERCARIWHMSWATTLSNGVPVWLARFTEAKITLTVSLVNWMSLAEHW